MSEPVERPVVVRTPPQDVRDVAAELDVALNRATTAGEVMGYAIEWPGEDNAPELNIVLRVPRDPSRWVMVQLCVSSTADRTRSIDVSRELRIGQVSC